MSSLTPTTDLTPARWLVDAVTEFGPQVRQLVPAGFDAFVRVFHRPDQGLPDDESLASWADAARRHGTVLHPEAQWRSLTGMAPDPFEVHREEIVEDQPSPGSLDRLTLPRLASLLALHTTTREACHVAAWDGFGSSPESWERSPRFRLPAREHWLFPPVPVREVPAVSVELELAGLEERAARPGGLPGLVVVGRATRPDDSLEWVRSMRESGELQSPTWWWPDDRAWVVHSEIDFDSTIVAGSTALRDALLGDPGIECLEVGPDVSLAFGADTVNAR